MSEGEKCKLTSKNVERMLDAHVVVYVDFECILKSVNICDNDLRICWTNVVSDNNVPCG